MSSMLSTLMNTQYQIQGVRIWVINRRVTNIAERVGSELKELGLFTLEKCITYNETFAHLL